ncbi:outer arm dynein light chain 1 [Coprinopsis marcescibilis]|uniref:Outer arm dynein light chain 1 n=1 Tax=Coprinopsis marcescibilis TaxID=230819 RepID=A0A5C3LCA2_COPMA|nr:outer arm dynein light chain 1 [Coprinopsis marcescibilis]
MQPPPPIPLGTRILHNGQTGTVKYVGPVDGTTGIWLGIDWDDPERGKHDGSKDNKRYFTARNPHSGSFIRRSANLQCGVSFLDAIRSKYLEDLHGGQKLETVILGSSQGAIEVEAVNLDKIRSKLARLDRLRAVSLDSTLVSSADPPGNIKETCPNIQSLDLSLSLVCEWQVVASIAVELPQLQRLALNRNPLVIGTPDNISFMASHFDNLTELEINDTLLGWPNIQEIVGFMPCLQSLEAGFNHLQNLGGAGGTATRMVHPALRSLNLDTNELSDWVEIMQTFGPIPLLEKLNFSSNQLKDIPPPTQGSGISYLRFLSLSANSIASWNDVENLSRWCTGIQNISLRDNPITKEPHARSTVVSYFPTLRTLDGTAISTRERNDSERLYLASLSKNKQNPVGDARPFRWDELCEKHGEPNAVVSVTEDDKLGSRLIGSFISDLVFDNSKANGTPELRLYQTTKPPEKQMTLHQDQEIVLNVLPSMTLRNFLGRVKRATKIKNVVLWMKMRDDSYIPLREADRTLDWIGLETGSQIVYQIR